MEKTFDTFQEYFKTKITMRNDTKKNNTQKENDQVLNSKGDPLNPIMKDDQKTGLKIKNHDKHGD